MKKEFLQVDFKVSNPVFVEVMIAELTSIGFDSFWEKEDGLAAFIDKKSYNKSIIDNLISQYEGMVKVEVLNVSALPDKNWNEEWEKQFEPIFIKDKIVVKAPFHKIEKNYPHTIKITPKMAFGTGHHATTSLMLATMLDIDFSNKNVLDYGCGTGILSIMAAFLSANHVFAIDNDHWSTENTEENLGLNEVENVEVVLGEKKTFEGKRFDIILANINRNVILDSFADMRDVLVKNGILLVSGILKEDLDKVVKSAKNHNFSLKAQQEKNNWLMLWFE